MSKLVLNVKYLLLLGAVHKLCRLGGGGEGGTPKDDLRRRGEGGGSKVKLCRLFAFQILRFFEFWRRWINLFAICHNLLAAKVT